MAMGSNYAYRESFFARSPERFQLPLVFGVLLEPLRSGVVEPGVNCSALWQWVGKLLRRKAGDRERNWI